MFDFYINEVEVTVVNNKLETEEVIERFKEAKGEKLIKYGGVLHC